MLPLDLRALYAGVLPVDPRFPDWRGDPGGEAGRGRAWVEGAMTADLSGWLTCELGLPADPDAAAVPLPLPFWDALLRPL